VSLKSLRERMGTAGLVVAVIALVAAMAGGAYAASGGLTGMQKKEVKKIAKKYAGKRGKTGATGPAGPQGADGAKGEKGDKGADGAAGTSAQTTSFSGEAHGCQEGGIEVTSAGPTAYVCNGVKGTTGFTSTLPSGKTETGVWSFGPTPAGAVSHQYVPISFSIPLAAAVTSVHFLDAGQSPTAECPGSAAEPLAEQGNLCIYSSENHESEPGFYLFENTVSPELAGVAAVGKTGRTGAIVAFKEVEELEFAFGVYAVSAP
jgi:hypothetical protein